MLTQAQIDLYRREGYRRSFDFSDWKILQEMWKKARYTLTGSDHIPQHRWGSRSPYCA